MTATKAAVARTRKPAQDRQAKNGAAPAFDVEAAVAAAAAESKQEAFSFKLRGKTFTLPPANDWDLEVSERLARNELGEALHAMLGDTEYERFRSVKPKLGEVNAIVQGLAKFSGVDIAGN